MTIATGIFYRKIHFLNSDRIPETGPAILIANHPGSLMDAALLGLLLKRPIHFFARGDIFKSSLTSTILRALHMHPVHHHLDGRSSLGANDQSFETALQLLENGELVLFFPEGFSHTEYYLLPFKKGSFRLAFQAMEKAGLKSMPILPIGFHYSHPTSAFRPVWIIAGEKIETAAYYFNNQDNPAQAIRKLCDAAFQAISAITIQVDKPRADLLFTILEVLRTEQGYQSMDSYKQWQCEKNISITLKNFTEYQLLPIKAYQAVLEESHLKEETITAAASPSSYKWHHMFSWLLASPGFLIHGIPLLTAKWIADHKVKRIDFYAWILVAAAALIDMVWHLLLLVLIGAFLSYSHALLFLILSLITGWISYKVSPNIIQANNSVKSKKIPASTVQQMRVKRSKMMEEIRASLS